MNGSAERSPTAESTSFVAESMWYPEYVDFENADAGL